MRPTWDDYFLMIAEAVSLRSTCPRRHVGVVVVDEQHHIVSTGYNGAPPGQLQCDEVGCDLQDGHCKRAIHADMNAILHARGSLAGCTMYIWGGTPCTPCATAIVRSGIQRVVCYGTYPDAISVELLRRRGIDLVVKEEVYRPLPVQVTTFEEGIKAIQDSARLLLLKKHHDYGADNIVQTGELGVLVRARDKIQRLWNLLNNGKDAQNEAIWDSWYDLLNYATIGLLLYYNWFEKPMFYKAALDEVQRETNPATPDVNTTWLY